MTSEEHRIKSIIKSLLKKSGMTYSDLAISLDISLPTVRRILTTESLSIERLVKICDILGTTFTDVIDMTKQPDLELRFLTEEQEIFFCKQPAHYSYLRCLGRGMSTDEIAHEFNLTSKQTDMFTAELEILGLIKRTGRDWKMLIKWPANFRFPGPLQEKFFSSIGTTFLRHLEIKTLDDKRGYGKDFYYFINPLLLVEDSYRKLVQDISDLQLKYKHISESERKRNHWSKLVRATSLFGVDKIDLLDQVMGSPKQA